jgi:serine/threonine protein phosphatase PrpC
LSFTKLEAGAATDVGRVRSINQDRLLVDDGVWVVADGMGGHAGGEVAARLAVETIHDHEGADAGADWLVEAIHDANRVVWERSRQDAGLRGMGTTVTAVALVVGADGSGPREPSLVVANVGDSRTYLYQRGELSQLTADHSLIEEMVRAGELSEDEAVGHPHRHVVTRVLGVDPDVEVDSWVLSPHVGDRLLLCSDGLVNEVDDGRIAAVLAEGDGAQAAADKLVSLARDHGGTDNISVIVLDVVADGDAGTDSASVLPGGEREVAPAPMETGKDQLTEAVPVIPAAPAVAAPATPPPVMTTPREGPRPRGRRVTFRVGVFVLAVLVILGGVVGLIFWYARGTYYVGLQGNQLVIYQGRPGAVLWMHATLAQRTDVTTAEVPQAAMTDLQQGMVEPSLDAARHYVSNLVDEYQAANPVPTTTTTTGPTTTGPTTTTTGPTTSTTAAPGRP